MTQETDTSDETQRLLRRRRFLGVAGAGMTTAIAGCGSSDDGSAGGDGSSGGSDEEPSDGGVGDDDSDASADSDGSDGEDTSDEDEEREEAEPASFAVAGVDHPDEVDVGEEHTLSFTIENTGGESGTYEEILEISVAGTEQWENVVRIEVEIPPGESVTRESEPFSFDQPGTKQFRLGDTEWAYDVITTEPETQSFAGSGAEVREDVSIQGGLTVVRATHSGESNFQVELAGGEFNNLFVNVIGDFDGAQATLVDSGEYILDVTADGSWEIDIEQPRSGQGESLPTSFSGSGPVVVGPVQFGGTGIASGEHDGESNFQVEFLPATGSFPELVFNEIGSYEGETTYSFDGIGWVDVNADGDWTLELE